MKEKSEEESPDEEESGSGEQEQTGKQEKQESRALHEDDTDEEDGAEPLIKPVEKSIGEGRDNLRQREGWFRRRTGMRS
jgi:hypothetical protein